MADIWSNLTGGKIHSGSWLGGLLPDLGATEAIAQTISGNQTTDLSDALTGNNNTVEQTGGGGSWGPVEGSTYTGPKTVTVGTNTGGSPTGGSPTPSQPQQQPSGDYSFNVGDFENYRGWDPAVAQQDWIAKGKPMPGGSGGGADPNEAIRNQLSGAWDSYFRNLDEQYNALPGQAQNMSGIAQNSYDQSVRDIGFEQENNQALLDKQYRKNDENQVRSLQDIADNIRNLYRSGNIYLGSRGAGDSSAANQYSYAVTKLGSKQRGDVLNQTRSIANDIADREAQLGRTVMAEKAKIKTDFDNKVLEISQWLQDAQRQVKEARANGELQKGQSLAQLSQDIYNQATNRLLQLENNATERTNALVSWATSNSANINQLKANLKEVSNITATNPTFSKISGAPQVDAQGNMRTYWSQSKDEDKKINGGY